jgi:hypothetical protein
MDQPSDRPIRPVSPDTLTLERLLMTMEVGETIRYETLSASIHRDVTREGRHHLVSAQRRVLRDHRMAFDCVWNIGLRRLDDVGKVEKGSRTVGKIRRAAKRGLRVVLSVQDFDAMPAAMRLKHNMVASLFGLTRAITGKRQQGLLAARLATSKPLSAADVKAIVAETLPRRLE